MEVGARVMVEALGQQALWEHPALVPARVGVKVLRAVARDG